MTHIPGGAEWYIAEVIMEIRIEGRPGNVVHRNFILVNAASPDDAYEKAIDLGASSEISYDNPAGEQVSIRFRGLADLSVIHDKLEHGGELMYSQEMNISEEKLLDEIRPKANLSVFSHGAQLSKEMDFRSGEVVKRLDEILAENE